AVDDKIETCSPASNLPMDNISLSSAPFTLIKPVSTVSIPSLKPHITPTSMSFKSNTSTTCAPVSKTDTSITFQHLVDNASLASGPCTPARPASAISSHSNEPHISSTKSSLKSYTCTPCACAATSTSEARIAFKHALDNISLHIPGTPKSACTTCAATEDAVGDKIETCSTTSRHSPDNISLGNVPCSTPTKPSSAVSIASAEPHTAVCKTCGAAIAAGAVGDNIETCTVISNHPPDNKSLGNLPCTPTKPASAISIPSLKPPVTPTSLSFKSNTSKICAPVSKTDTSKTFQQLLDNVSLASAPCTAVRRASAISSPKIEPHMFSTKSLLKSHTCKPCECSPTSTPETRIPFKQALDNTSLHISGTPTAVRSTCAATSDAVSDKIKTCSATSYHTTDNISLGNVPCSTSTKPASATSTASLEPHITPASLSIKPAIKEETRVAGTPVTPRAACSTCGAAITAGAVGDKIETCSVTSNQPMHKKSLSDVPCTPTKPASAVSIPSLKPHVTPTSLSFKSNKSTTCAPVSKTDTSITFQQLLDNVSLASAPSKPASAISTPQIEPHISSTKSSFKSHTCTPCACSPTSNPETRIALNRPLDDISLHIPGTPRAACSKCAATIAADAVGDKVDACSITSNHYKDNVSLSSTPRTPTRPASAISTHSVKPHITPTNLSFKSNASTTCAAVSQMHTSSTFQHTFDNISSHTPGTPVTLTAACSTCTPAIAGAVVQVDTGSTTSNHSPDNMSLGSRPCTPSRPTSGISTSLVKPHVSATNLSFKSNTCTPCAGAYLSKPETHIVLKHPQDNISLHISSMPVTPRTAYSTCAAATAVGAVVDNIETSHPMDNKSLGTPTMTTSVIATPLHEPHASSTYFSFKSDVCPSCTLGSQTGTCMPLKQSLDNASLHILGTKTTTCPLCKTAITADKMEICSTDPSLPMGNISLGSISCRASKPTSTITPTNSSFKFNVSKTGTQSTLRHPLDNISVHIPGAPVTPTITRQTTAANQTETQSITSRHPPTSTPVSSYNVLVNTRVCPPHTVISKSTGTTTHSNSLLSLNRSTPISKTSTNTIFQTSFPPPETPKRLLSTSFNTFSSPQRTCATSMTTRTETGMNAAPSQLSHSRSATKNQSVNTFPLQLRSSMRNPNSLDKNSYANRTLTSQSVLPLLTSTATSTSNVIKQLPDKPSTSGYKSTATSMDYYVLPSKLPKLHNNSACELQRKHMMSKSCRSICNSAINSNYHDLYHSPKYLNRPVNSSSKPSVSRNIPCSSCRSTPITSTPKAKWELGGLDESIIQTCSSTYMPISSSQHSNFYDNCSKSMSSFTFDSNVDSCVNCKCGDEDFEDTP
ncbi:hypothetical protein ILUMI_26157, partial [Ignelater luminosus]